MTGPHNRLRPWQRQAIDGSGALLLASGAVWLLLHYGRGDELPHPLEPWSMRLHGLASFVSLFMLGVLAAFHVPHGWRATARHGLRQPGRAQRRWGLLLCVLAAALAASGYALYYFAPDNVRPALGGAHSAAGAAMAGALLAHRRARRRDHPLR
jgi:peptidoglycan/LPS O-acetylase OafA/YrhL